MIGRATLSDFERRDQKVQREIALDLVNYTHIDLTIPAQREVANNVRSKFDLPPLSDLRPAFLIEGGVQSDLIREKQQVEGEE
jgi:hypothetical protein